MLSRFDPKIKKEFNKSDLKEIINTGITFFICSKRSFRSNLRMEGYRKIKMYQNKAQEWVIIFIDIDSDGPYSMDFKIFKENWKFNPKMEKILKNLNMNKIE